MSGDEEFEVDPLVNMEVLADSVDELIEIQERIAEQCLALVEQRMLGDEEVDYDRDVKPVTDMGEHAMMQAGALRWHKAMTLLMGKRNPNDGAALQASVDGLLVETERFLADETEER